MSYWIATGNRTNWEIVKINKIWGIPKRNKNIHIRVKEGDIILMYVRLEGRGNNVLPPAIVGDFNVIELFEDTEPLFIAPPQMRNEVFPYRLKLNNIRVFTKPIEIKALIPELGFITNKTMWTGHFRQTMREIPEEDYLKIVKSS